MHIIILGAGKVGKILTKYLVKEEHDIVVIDLKEEKIEDVVNTYDVIGVCGNGACYDILMEAGVQHADLIICVTASDELNILAGLLAKQMGTHHTIARVRNPEYSKQKDFMRNQLGFSMIINPELETAYEISRIISFPSASKVESFASGKVELMELRLDKDNRLVDVTLQNLSSISKANILVCAIYRHGEVIIPDGNTALQVGDRIHITGTHQDLVKYCYDIGVVTRKVKNVMIVGGGAISYYLAQQLHSLGIQVKIVENRHERCLVLARKLPFATIIESDGSDEDVLNEEGIQKMDACIALTGIDEENIVIALYAKHLQVKKVIAKVTRMNFNGLIDSINVDSVVSPKTIIASQIVRYVRAKMNKDDDSSVKTLYKIVDGEVEAMEFVASAKTDFLGKKVADIKIKEGIIIAAIFKNNTLIIPKGDSVIEQHDHVIVISQDQKIRCLQDIVRGQMHE